MNAQADMVGGTTVQDARRRMPTTDHSTPAILPSRISWDEKHITAASSSTRNPIPMRVPQEDELGAGRERDPDPMSCLRNMRSTHYIKCKDWEAGTVMFA